MNTTPRKKTETSLPESTVELTDVEDGADSDPEPLPLSQVFDLLSNERRRQVVRVLRERDGSSTLSEIAEIIAAWENDKEVSELTSSERKRTYVGLYQCHLPKMDDHGVIEFDKHRGDVRLGPNAPVMFEYIDGESDPTRPWATYYLALAGAWGGVFVLGQAAGIAALAPLVGLQLLTFTLCSIAHYRATDDTDEDGPPVPLVDDGDVKGDASPP